MNSLFLGDNLEILRTIDTESVDLVYLDPPFFSNRNYEVIWGDKGEVRSFQDRWSGGIDHYIAWLKERVAEMHRILKPTGSIFLHCDWHANAYIRVYILDKLFGEGNFLSEIIWKRTFNSGSSKSISKKFPLNTDTIYWYRKGEEYTFNKVTRPLNKGALKRYDKVDEQGRIFKWNPLKTVSKERLEKLIAEGEAKVIPSSKYPIYKHYLDVDKGVLLNNLWEDIDVILDNEERLIIASIDNLWEEVGQIATQNTGERLGYPTQKPEALMERIINCASNEGDVVLDPFVGGGTTVAVADRLNRAWIGIDQSVQAVKVTEMRLQKQQNLFSKPFITVLHKYDYDTLRYKDAFQFEEWIVTQRGGLPNTKQRSDFGIDGKHRDGTPIQVKRSDNVGRNVIDNFASAAKRFDSALFEKNKSENKPVGEIIAFSFNKGAVQEVARLKNEENIIIELVKVEDFIPIAKKPTIKVTFTDLGLDAKNKREIAFKAEGGSEAGIEFYAWQWNYNKEDGFKPDEMIDKTGEQKQKFSAGTYNIAVKVVDNDGLEAIEVVRLKVNGGVSVG